MKDHLISDLTKDEYYLMIYEAAKYSWNCHKWKYRVTIAVNNIHEEDAIQDVLLKVMQPKKDGTTYYGQACSNNWTTGCIKSFVYKIMCGYLVDKGKVRYEALNAPSRLDIYDQIDMLEGVKMPECLVYEDKSDLSIRELLEESKKLKTRQGITFDVILREFLEGDKSLNKVCEKYHIDKKSFIKKLKNIEVKDYLCV